MQLHSALHVTGKLELTTCVATFFEKSLHAGILSPVMHALVSQMLNIQLSCVLFRIISAGSVDVMLLHCKLCSASDMRRVHAVGH